MGGEWTITFKLFEGRGDDLVAELIPLLEDLLVSNGLYDGHVLTVTRKVLQIDR